MSNQQQSAKILAQSMRFAISTVLVAMLTASCYAQVGVTPDGSPWLCNFAKIRTDIAAAPVFLNHTSHSRRLTKLHANDAVYVCDSWGTNKWDKVFFPIGSKRCASGTTNGLPHTKRNDCGSGWIEDRFIDIISG